jgi:hypothetical protein
MNDIKNNTKKAKTVNLDENTIRRCEKYAQDHALSLSGAVRTIISEFFLTREER